MCVERECLVEAHSSVIISILSDDGEFSVWVVLCCVGSFDGWCRRRLIDVLGDCAYVTPGVLVLSVG